MLGIESVPLTGIIVVVLAAVVGHESDYGLLQAHVCALRVTW